MDIPVSHLNTRMALQVPPELPLGLVFIVGHVQGLHVAETDEQLMNLQLRDDEHVLDCRLTKRIADETLLKEGDRVRVGGQLTFSVLSARYQLVAHHLEVLAPAADKKVASTPLAEHRSGGEESALASPELPDWVLKLAPPEIRQELGFAVAFDETDIEPAAVNRHERAATAPTKQEPSSRAPGTDFIAGLPPEMVRFLSQAIDSEEDVELTPEMLTAFAYGDKPDPGPVQSRKSEERSARASRHAVSLDVQKRQQPGGQKGETDDLVELFVAWLANPQLYLIPLLMFLVFLTAIFVFVLFQQ